MTTDNKTLAVDVLAVMHSVLGDLMAAQVAGVDTDTRVPELSASIDVVGKLIESTSLLVAQLALHGDMDDGCFYYNGRSASELQTPMADVSAALARVKGESA
ncbi:hypothetical protein D7U89_06590 [Stenotrophomonas maltophilia]|uniref:hypothetical protein n=1 Tax=Stenotrophomonas maltophilia group TaxID=995085 RepID=UPI0015DEF357|nr:hypothetical protein [Stenotrophomonas maltophilia]MBA0225159.1 hypothetical protein [Stenotrophomonas maltophilia]MBA0365280.1 hypothetical protein [Stenotrophomonas maltophilia]